MSKAPFWKEKTLKEMTRDEWESLCDGCGLCCMVKLENIDTKEIVTTNVACKYLDLKTCQCSDYQNRHKNVPDCISLTPRKIPTLDWLPTTCAYRLIEEGKDLYPWHHLISGDKEAVHKAGISKKGMIVSEASVSNYTDYIIESLNRDLQTKGQNLSSSSSCLTRGSMDPQVKHEDDNVEKIGFKETLQSDELMK